MGNLPVNSMKAALPLIAVTLGLGVADARAQDPVAVCPTNFKVLAEDQTALSQSFARSGVDKFAGVPWTRSRMGSPVLQDVVAWIDCELWAEYDGGDHTLVVARVLDLGADPTRRPLLFHRGAYGLLDVSRTDG